jgi:hypothetical protein
MRPTALALTVLLSLSLAAQESPAARVKRVLADPRFGRAMAVLDRDHDKLVADIITLTEIASPPFKEDRRAAAVLELFRKTSLTGVERDAEGNVTACGAARPRRTARSHKALDGVWKAPT